MSANYSPSRTLGWLAIAVGGVILLGDVSLILFFTIGSFFGTFNDLCIAFAAILSGILSWILYPANRAYSPRLSQIAANCCISWCARSLHRLGIRHLRRYRLLLSWSHELLWLWPSWLVAIGVELLCPAKEWMAAPLTSIWAG